MRVHGSVARLLQLPHVIRYNPLKKRTCVLPLDFYQGPVRKVIAHKLPRGTRAAARTLAVLLDAREKRYAQIPTGELCGVNADGAARRDRPSGETQAPHVSHGDGAVLFRLSGCSTPVDQRTATQRKTPRLTPAAIGNSILKPHNALLDNIGPRARELEFAPAAV